MNFAIKTCSRLLNPSKQKFYGLFSNAHFDSTLSQSTVFLQDGFEVRELPWIVKKLCASEVYGLPSFKALSYSRGEILQCTDDDFHFEKQLRACNDVQQVIKLLEIPDDLVTIHSATFALQRIGELAALKHISIKDKDSFVSRAVLNELCETIAKDVQLLNNQNLIDLIGCCSRSYIYSQSFADVIVREIESRLAGSHFKILELCDLISMLSQCVKPDGQLVKMLWIHLGSRYKEFDENNITHVYQVMEFKTPKWHYIFRLLDQQLLRCWWKLQSSDVTKICIRLNMARHFSNIALQSFGKWLYTNIQAMTVDEMKQLLSLYTHFQYHDANLVTALEKLVSARVTSLSTADKTLLMMTMDYLQQNRILSPSILNSMADDFIANHADYNVLQACSIISGFGLFYHDPILVSSQLFKAIESWLDVNLNKIAPHKLVQLLTSFVYIEKFPVNFIRSIFNPHAINSIKELSNIQERTKSLKNLLELQASCLLEFPSKAYINFNHKKDLNLPLTWIDGRAHKLHQEVKQILKNILKGVSIFELHVPNYYPYLINFEIPSNSIISSQKIDKRIALIICMPEDRCTNNNNHFLGPYMLKMRHLFKLGYRVIPIDYKVFVWKCKTEEKKSKYIHDLLLPLMNDKH